ncbi:MAG: hypothetical protein PUD44_11815 [Clostridiaceae bacterium]|nr:hypothetical protein [Clostridiaceae bacterium]
MEKNCPCCERHCPENDLGCRRGKEHFGMADGARPEGRHGGHPGGRPEAPATPEDRVLLLLRKAGHFLHHSAGAGADSAALLSALTAEERETLGALLEKCTASWEK